MNKLATPVILVCFVMLVGLVTQVSPVLADSSDPYERVLSEADAMVTVKFVLNVKMAGMGSDREIENEAYCLLIASDGLTLCSNTELGGYVSLMSRMAGSAGFDVSAAPKEIRVLVDDSTEGVPASLIARDSDRDLAWLSLDEAPEAPLPFLDLSHGAELGIGETFYRLRRMDKFFGRAPLVEHATIAGMTDKPRRLLVPSPQTAAGSGLPVFSADGRVVGITVVQVPSLEDAGTATRGGGLLGVSSQTLDMIGGLILPVADVIKATSLAREIAAEDKEER